MAVRAREKMAKTTTPGGKVEVAAQWVGMPAAAGRGVMVMVAAGR
jgi:hypothetical protein